MIILNLTLNNTLEKILFKIHGDGDSDDDTRSDVHDDGDHDDIHDDDVHDDHDDDGHGDALTNGDVHELDPGLLFQAHLFSPEP